jgi:hypothetical protein
MIVLLVMKRITFKENFLLKSISIVLLQKLFNNMIEVMTYAMMNLQQMHFTNTLFMHSNRYKYVMP